MKIALDECLTTTPSQAVIGFLGLCGVPAVYYPHYAKYQGAKDGDIARRLASEGGWTVISLDLDRSRKKSDKRAADGPPLHKILPACGVTSVFLEGLSQSDAQEKAWAIIAAWPSIKAAVENQDDGSRFRVERLQGRSSYTYFRVKPWPLKEGELDSLEM